MAHGLWGYDCAQLFVTVYTEVLVIWQSFLIKYGPEYKILIPIEKERVHKFRWNESVKLSK